MITIVLLSILVLTYVLQMLIPGFTEAFWFDPKLALSHPWIFITSIFLHGSLSHILLNGYALFLFGTILERKIGKIKFLITFFTAGIAGSIFYYLFVLLGNAPIPALGASGAIFGIFGAVAVLIPDMVIYIYLFPMRMKYAVILFAIISILGSFDVNSGIAHAAHLGGLIVGVILGKIYKQEQEVLPYPYSYHYEWQNEDEYI